MDSVQKDYARLLPYLRRYARALVGSPELADDLVLLTIERLAEQQSCDGGSERALSPYRELHRLYDNGHYPAVTRPQALHPLERALHSLDETSRRIYLMVNLQSLPTGEVGEVFDLPTSEVMERLQAIRARVHDQLMADIMIVEDDAIIAYDLSVTVREMGHSVCGTASTMAEALEVAARYQPTLALMDIRLAAGDNGIEVAQALRRQRNLPMIFVTAFPDELERNGVSHLGPVIRKPFNREQIEQAITRAVFTPASG